MLTLGNIRSAHTLVTGMERKYKGPGGARAISRPEPSLSVTDRQIYFLSTNISLDLHNANLKRYHHCNALSVKDIGNKMHLDVSLEGARVYSWS